MPFHGAEVGANAPAGWKEAGPRVYVGTPGPARGFHRRVLRSDDLPGRGDGGPLCNKQAIFHHLPSPDTAFASSRRHLELRTRCELSPKGCGITAARWLTMVCDGSEPALPLPRKRLDRAEQQGWAACLQVATTVPRHFPAENVCSAGYINSSAGGHLPCDIRPPRLSATS